MDPLLVRMLWELPLVNVRPPSLYARSHASRVREHFVGVYAIHLDERHRPRRNSEERREVKQEDAAIRSQETPPEAEFAVRLTSGGHQEATPVGAEYKGPAVGGRLTHDEGTGVGEVSTTQVAL